MLDVVMPIGIMCSCSAAGAGSACAWGPCDVLRPLKHTRFAVVSQVTCRAVCPLVAALAPISAVAADERGVVMIAIGAVSTLPRSAIIARQIGRIAAQPAARELEA